MTYSLKIPRKGFDEFQTYRYAYEDQVHVIIGEDSYIFNDLDTLRIWFKNVGVPVRFIEKFLDLIWNFRRIHYSVKDHYLTIPKDQSSPLEEKDQYQRIFRWPRQEDTEDPFDPLSKSRFEIGDY